VIHSGSDVENGWGVESRSGEKIGSGGQSGCGI
jgi:hypothetical protein